eukprot:g9.t1
MTFSKDDYIYVLGPEDKLKDPNGKEVPFTPGEDLLRCTFNHGDPKQGLYYQYIMRRDLLERATRPYTEGGQGVCCNAFLCNVSDENYGLVYDALTDVQLLSSGQMLPEQNSQEMEMINARADVVGDNLWIWRADHAFVGQDTQPDPQNSLLPMSGRVPKASEYYLTAAGDYPAKTLGVLETATSTGLEVFGDFVTIYGLAVEHFIEDNTIWHLTCSISLGEGKWAIKQSNVFFSGSVDGTLRAWRFGRDEGEQKGLQMQAAAEPILAPGCINQIAVGKRFVACAIGKEHKFGRWFYEKKEKNGVLLVPLSYKEV